MLMMTAGPLVRPRHSLPQNPALREIRAQGNALFRNREYLRAAHIHAEGYQRSLRSRDTASAIRFLINLGGCRFAMFQYRGALDAYLEAKRLAEMTGDTEMLATVSANLSSLYLQMEEPNAGLAVSRETLDLLRKEGRSKYLPLLLAQSALLSARVGDMRSASRLYQDAVEAADRMGDTASRALASNRFGYLLMRRGQLDTAERVLLEAFRLSKLYRLQELDYSYYLLGLLKLEQGELPTDARLLDEAVKRALQGSGTVPLWRVYHARGQARLRQGSLKAALADLESALEFAGRWRAELPSSDSVWTNTTADLQKVYTAYVYAAARLYFRTGDERYARQAFTASEENRAAGLRVLLSVSGNRRMPVEYWQTLAQLRASETELLRAGKTEIRRRIDELRFRLTEIETRSGLETPGPEVPGRVPFDRVQGAIASDEALLSFHLGETESYRWELTGESFHMKRLPSRRRLRELVKQFSLAVRAGSETEAGEMLYAALFGHMGRSAREKAHWKVVPEHELFEAPLSALVTGRRGREPVYLVESHSLATVPAAAIRRTERSRAYDGPFVGVGDAVYNAADSRWRAIESEAAEGGFFRLLPSLFARPVSASTLEMARLAGSGKEIRACARAWSDVSSPVVLLDGPRASRADLSVALGSQPAAIHFATHFVMSSGSPKQAMIALSLGQGGNTELVTAAEIKQWRLDGPVVALSGCSSGSADALPGEGLLGMSRAWLAAGAEAVVASLWPTPDDNGGLFVSFYRSLRRVNRDGVRSTPALALQEAQLEMLRSSTWRSEPRYWAAHFVAGKE